MFRIGSGYDVHQLVEGRALILGGVEIPFEKGSLGHSDGDVLAHAIADALLGATALGDIGHHFPDTDLKYKGADSLSLLHQLVLEIESLGYKISNVDSTLILEKPKIAPFIQEIRTKLAHALNCSVDQVSVKATTTEKLGFTGRGEGVAASAICLVTKSP
jgi:2-C-methyl-D-erythritol 2,4-cyclodiphosphate synthase